MVMGQPAMIMAPAAQMEPPAARTVQTEHVSVTPMTEVAQPAATALTQVVVGMPTTDMLWPGMTATPQEEPPTAQATSFEAG